MKKQLINLAPVKDLVRDKLLEKYNSTTFLNTTQVNLTVDVSEILNEYITKQNIQEPKIYMTTDAYCKMRTLVKETDTEIGWYGIVNNHLEGLPYVYIIEDIIVYPQKVTGVTCEQDEEKMFEFEMSLTTEQVNNKRFHGHSHVNMGVTASGVDEQFYQDLLTQTKDYLITIITNKNGLFNLRFYDIKNNILYTDMTYAVLLEDGTDIDLWYKEVEEKLTRPVSRLSTLAGAQTNSKIGLNTYNYDKDTTGLGSYHYGLYDDEDEEDDPLIWDKNLCAYKHKSELDRIYGTGKKKKKGKK